MSPSGRLWLALFLVISGVFTHSLPMASSVSASATLVVQLLASLSANEQAALLESCSLAHQPGRCVDIAEASEADTFRALIDFESDTRVTLEITDRDPSRSLYASRELAFEPGDDREERARAIGLALGVLATALETGRPPKRVEPPEDPDDKEAKPPPVEEPRPAQEDPKPPPSPPPESPPSRGLWGISLSGGLRVAPNWGVAAPTGALGILGYLHPNFGGHLNAQLASFSPGSRNISLTHISATLGPTFRTVSTPFFVSSALALGVQSTEARLNFADADVRKGSHISPLVHAELTVGRDIAPGVAVTFSPTFDVLLSETEISLDERPMGSTGTTQASFLFGLLLMPQP